MSHRTRAQQAYSAYVFLVTLASLSTFVTVLIFVATRHRPGKLLLISIGISLVLARLARLAKLYTVQYQRLAQLSNIARGSVGHRGMSTSDYDRIASWMDNNGG